MPLGRTIENYAGVVGRTRYECSACMRIHRFAEAAERCCTHPCPNCGNLYSYPEDAQDCCRQSQQCSECGSLYDTLEEAAACCQDIRQERERQRQRMRERDRYPREILMQEPAYRIMVPALPDRPARLCSIEQELSDGGYRAARLLYDMQMSQYHTLTNYSTDCQPGEAVVKQDSSLDRHYGGEVLYSRFSLWTEAHARRFSKAIWYLRQLRNQGLVTTSRNAGLHIHIGVIAFEQNGRAIQERVFGPGQMAALYEIFTFCEDVLFRLAAAGWKDHRGTRFTIIHPKQEKMSPGVLMKLANRERHYSLNFARLLNAVRECQCGACVVGDWQECECGALNKGTVEWRIFNATTKPETMHAWLLLAHAITAKAFDYQLGELHPNGYQETDQERHAWILGWILNECPFLPEEREIVLSLAKRSPGLHVDWDALEATIELPSMTDVNGDDDEEEIVTMEEVAEMMEEVNEDEEGPFFVDDNYEDEEDDEDVEEIVSDPTRNITYDSGGNAVWTHQRSDNSPF